MAKKLHYNDEVIVITGKNKGKRGKIKQILSNNKAIVSGINMVTKHQKPIPSIHQLGGIFQKEAVIDISNLAILNVISNKPDRVAFIYENKCKIRIFKSDRKIIK